MSVQDQIVDTLKTVQDAVIDSVRQAADTAEGFAPDLSFIPYADEAAAFAGRIYELQKDFVVTLLDAVKPLVGAGTSTNAES